ncbi:MAG: HDOD domain-containing protein, partial [Planctomycetota bacterium]
MRHIFQDEPDIQKIAGIIRRDPTLTAKLFKSVNSAAFGLKVQINNVHQAVSLLGLETLKETIISLSLGEYFITNYSSKVLDAKEFCIHSLASAVILSEAAKAMGFKESEQLFLLGLLHDLGTLALDSLPDYNYEKVFEGIEAGKSLEESEMQEFGCTSSQVWDYLATSWCFPSGIVDLKKGYLKGHSLAITTGRFIEFACRLADSMGYYFIKPKLQGLVSPFETFRLPDQEIITHISRKVKKQVNAIAGILDLPSPDSTHILKLLWRMNIHLQETNIKYHKANMELKLRVEVHQNLAKAFTGIIKSLNNETISFSVLESVINGFQADSAFLLHMNKKGGLTGLVGKNTSITEASMEKKQFGAGEIPPYIQKCFESQVPIKITHPIEDGMLKECLGDIQLAWIAPIHVRGKLTSILAIGTRDADNEKFNIEDFEKIFQIISGEAGLSLENSRLYHRMKDEARTDPLTNISNRRTIIKILSAEFARYRRKGTPLTVAIFDMDNFKAINDTRGHLAGDAFLTKAARIFKKGIRQSDYIGRYGGDEFIAVFPDTTPSEAKAIVERIRETVEEYCATIQGDDIGKK